MRILAEGVHSIAFDTEQSRYVLVTVQAVRDKKWNDNHIWRTGELVPLRDQWRFFHVCVQNGGKFAARANPFRFPFGGYGTLVVQFRSMRDNEKRGLGWLDLRRDFMGAR